MSPTKLALIVAGMLALGMAWADDAPVAPLQGPRMLAEVNILHRVVPLQLTDDQLDAILAAYDRSARAQQAVLDSDAGQALVRLKTQLLQGVTPTAAEVESLRIVSRDANLGRNAAVGLTDLLQSIEDILTPRQMAILAAQGAAGLAADKNRRYAADQVINHLGPYLAVLDEEWPDVAARLAASLAAAVPDTDPHTAAAPGADPRTADVPDAGLRASAIVDIGQFLDRVRTMDSAQRSTRRDELSEELCALLPGGVPLSWEVPLEAPRGRTCPGPDRQPPRPRAPAKPGYLRPTRGAAPQSAASPAVASAVL